MGKVAEKPQLTLKEYTFYVDENPEHFIRKVRSERMNGSMRVHFRDGKITKPFLWTQKKRLD